MAINVKGLVLESQYADYNYCIKGPIITDFSTGFARPVPKHIVLEFDSFLCEVDEIIQNNELTSEDEEYIARALEYQLKNPKFNEMWIHEKPRPGVPWPTYDETPATQIPMIAKTIGVIRDALTYETRGREPRPSVVKKLEELLDDSPGGDGAEDLDLAAV